MILFRKELKWGDIKMNGTILGIIGFLTIGMVIFLLFKNFTIPSLAFITASTITAIILVLTGTFTISEVGEFIEAGVAGTSPTACLFLFSVLFFGIMTDTGMFDRIIGALVKKVGDSVVGVAVMTCFIAMIAHLDGSGAATFLITVPAMLPIYKRLNMRPTTLMLICVTAMGVMNLLPWGGPTMRAASVVGVEANVLWKQLMPMQGVGLILALVTAFIWGKIEVRRGAGVHGKLVTNTGSGDIDDLEQESNQENKNNELERPKNFVVNVILTISVVISLVFLKLPAYLMFMVGCSLAIFINYPNIKLQSKVIKKHSGPAIMMSSTLFAAGVFLGMLEESGLMEHMATILSSILPQALGPFLPILIGLLSVPLTLVFCTDAYFYGLLPVLISLGNAFGVDPVQTAISMEVCRNCATFISPVVPATFLGVGLAGIEIKDHIKNSFFWVWGVSIICLISGLLFGIIQL